MVGPPASSLTLSILRQHLSTIAGSATAGVMPHVLVARALQMPVLAPLLSPGTPVHVLAIGKAAAGMLAAFDRAHPGVRSAMGIGPETPDRLPPGAEWHTTAHPVPDERSVAAGRRALALAASINRDETLVVLLSGGASALAAVPVDGVTLEDKASTVARLLRQGADIQALNTVRKHLSAIKGGRLALATPGRVITLAISDVVGDDLGTIGSGPGVPDATTFADAWAVLERFGGPSRFPASVVEHLDAGCRGLHPDTPKDLDSQRVRAVVAGAVRDALDAAEVAARALGYRVLRASSPTVGPAREAGAALVRWAARVASDPRPCCLLAGGETTVQVTGQGRGGRNQELALAMVPAIDGLGQIAALSMGTDGIDGPTDAAGAFVDATSAARARALGLDVEQSLADNDSYGFFSVLGDLVHTGPTGTNVGDVQVVLLGPNGASGGST